MGVNVTVFVVILVDKDYDRFVAGVRTSQVAAEGLGQICMEYDESITEFEIQPEELLEKAED